MPWTSFPVGWSALSTIETGAPGTTCEMLGTGCIGPELPRSLKPPLERPPRPRPLFEEPRLDRFACWDEFILGSVGGVCASDFLFWTSDIVLDPPNSGLGSFLVEFLAADCGCRFDEVDFRLNWRAK